MIKVAPSILSADFVNLERDIRKLSETGVDYVHVDVMDGIFVPNITIGIPVVAAIRRITDLPLDVHLMIDRPLRYVEQFCKAGSDLLTVHVEADTEENTLETLKKIRANGVRAAVSIKPNTPAEAVLPFLPLCDLILMMTVEPGFGGQAFMEHLMPKLRQLRAYIDAQNPACELEVDGALLGFFDKLKRASAGRRRLFFITDSPGAARDAHPCRRPHPQRCTARLPRAPERRRTAR